MNLGITPSFNTTKAQAQQKQSNPNFGMKVTILNEYADSFRKIADLGDEPRCFLADLKEVTKKFNETFNIFAKDKEIKIKDGEYIPWNICIPSKLKITLDDGREYSIHRKLTGKEYLSPQETIMTQLKAIEGQEVALLSPEEFTQAAQEL